MKTLKALFLLFLVLLFLMSAIPTNDTGVNDNRGPAPTPNEDGAAVLGTYVAYSDWQQVDSKGPFIILKECDSQCSETSFMA